MKYYIIYDQDIIALFWKPEYIHHFKKGNMKIEIVESYSDALEWIDTFYKNREENPFKLYLLSKQKKDNAVGGFKLYHKENCICTFIKQQELHLPFDDLNYYILYRALECCLEYNIPKINLYFNFTAIYKRYNGHAIPKTQMSKIYDNEIREMRKEIQTTIHLLNEEEFNTECKELLNKPIQDNEWMDYKESISID